MAKAKRRAQAARKTKRKPARAASVPEAPRRAVPGPLESPREQDQVESVEDPLEDWPEGADTDEDRWLEERKAEDEEKPD